MKSLNNNKQMKDVWTTSLTKPSEKKQGKHPTQKAIRDTRENYISIINRK